jgi:hypothetical protein
MSHKKAQKALPQKAPKYLPPRAQKGTNSFCVFCAFLRLKHE